MSKMYLPYLMIFILYTCNINSARSQMMMDMDCLDPMLLPMEREHCKVMSLVPECCATHIAIADGSWFTASTWSTGTVPVEGDNVYIPDSTTITYNGSSNEAINWLRVNGTLNFATNMNTKLVVGTIVVDTEGTFTMGTFASPVASNYTTSIVFADLGPINTIWDPFLFSRGIVCLGHFESYGAYKRAHSDVQSGLEAGSNKLTLPVVPTGWSVGDQIVLTGTYTGISTPLDTNNIWHNEELTITSISGSDIYFTNNYDGSNQLMFDHHPPSGYDLKVHVANLTRNVTFQTQNFESIPSLQRAHAMFMHSLDFKINSTAFIGMGRTDKNFIITDPSVNEFGELVSGGDNPRGRYACHIHFGGALDATLTPVTVSNSVVNGTPGWGFVNHQSYVQMDQNVVFNFRGSAFVSEDGNEIGSMTGNIAIQGLKDFSGISRVTRIIAFDMGFDGTGFWIQSPNIDYANNIAASCSGAGFAVFSDDDDMSPSKRYLLPKSTLLHPEIAGSNESIYQAIVPLRSNTGSIVYNTSVAFSMWTHMKNGDDVGDFSLSIYDPFTHQSRSLIENFKFWNIYSTGFDLSYSSQVTFKNGLLLGDLENRFEGVESADPAMGYAFHSNTSGSSYEYDNLQVEGWIFGPVIFRTDDQFTLDNEEYNYRVSRIIGGQFSNITYLFHPEEGYDEYQVGGYFKFPKYFEIIDEPEIEVTLPDNIPIADFTYWQMGNNTVCLNGLLSLDTDPFESIMGNGIVSYIWNLPDGAKRYGADPLIKFSAPGIYSVTLTVFDCVGQSNSVTKQVHIEDVEYTNGIINSGFEDGNITDGGSVNSTKSSTSAGWYYKGAWRQIDGKAKIGLSVGYQRPLLQVIKDDYLRKGDVEFSFQAKNEGSNASDNIFIAEVFGVNGEFKYQNLTISGDISKWNNDDDTFESVLLFQEDFGGNEFGWETFKRNVDFGEGYEYIIVRFASENLKAGQEDTTSLDNVCLPCVCVVPGGGFVEELTTNHARLSWDNVGASQYILQYRPNGGTWITDTLDNTFKAIDGLLPGTLYQWRLSALCDGVYTDFSAHNKFTTLLEGSACTTPVSLNTTFITDHSAILNWNIVPGAISYKVNYKIEGATSWTSITTTQNSFVLAGLESGSIYNWRIRTECAEGWKPNSTTMTFATLVPREGEGLSGNADLVTSIYPNPADDVVQVMFYCDDEQEVKFRIYDLSGKLIATKTTTGNAGASVVQFDVSDISAGTYIVKVNSDEQTISEMLVIY